MSKKILITGATGYIGSHLTKKLCDHGYTIVAVDYKLNQNDISAYTEKTLYWDIREDKKILNTTFDCVVHLAAKTKVSESVFFPYEFYHTNIIGTQNVLKNINFDNFIYCSTGAAFQPDTSPYAMSKRAGEDLVKLLDKFSICRFYNVSGNHGFKKFDDNHYHLIRKAAAVANGLYDHIDVYGNDYDTRDGTTIRNYTHVDDITESLKELVINGPTNNIECLGSTHGYTVLEIIKIMEKISRKSIQIKMSGRRPGDSVISTLPEQSKFFTQKYDIEAQCVSALQSETK